MLSFTKLLKAVLVSILAVCFVIGANRCIEKIQTPDIQYLANSIQYMLIVVSVTICYAIEHSSGKD